MGLKGFGIYVKNDLLEPKHISNMGEAVWLYLWLLDKMTSINENGVGKVLGNKPVVYEQIELELGISLRTYRRWIAKLKEHGYIATLRTPRGLIITVHKAKKIFGNSRATNGTSLTKRSATNGTSDVHNVAHRVAKNGTSNKDNTNTIQLDNTSITNVIGGLSPAEYKKIVSKLYYEVIKELDLPKLNNNNIRTWINEMAADPDRQKIVNYLTFLRDQYKTTHWKFKPSITEAIHIHKKRATIRETFTEHVKGTNKPKGRGFKVS